MNDPLEIPEHIRKAAATVEIFFKVNGINEWALMGIQSRRSAHLDALHRQLDGSSVRLTPSRHDELLDAESELAALKAELVRLLEWFQNSYNVERCEFSPTEWKTLRDNALAERDALKLKLEVAATAVRYYAQPELYKVMMAGSIPRIMADEGLFAREALSQLNECSTR